MDTGRSLPIWVVRFGGAVSKCEGRVPRGEFGKTLYFKIYTVLQRLMARGHRLKGRHVGYSYYNAKNICREREGAVTLGGGHHSRLGWFFFFEREFY